MVTARLFTRYWCVGLWPSAIDSLGAHTSHHGLQVTENTRHSRWISQARLRRGHFLPCLERTAVEVLGLTFPQQRRPSCSFTPPQSLALSLTQGASCCTRPSSPSGVFESACSTTSAGIIVMKEGTMYAEARRRRGAERNATRNTPGLPQRQWRRSESRGAGSANRPHLDHGRTLELSRATAVCLAIDTKSPTR